VRALANAKIEEMKRRIATLEAMRRSLEALVGTCNRSARNRLCPLIRSIDEDA
jgi:hypothetical protein